MLPHIQVGIMHTHEVVRMETNRMLGSVRYHSHIQHDTHKVYTFSVVVTII